MMMMCDMFYYGFHARCTSMFMSLNGTKHMYIIMAGLHMMIYKALCLDVFICLCFPKVWKACI
jgi:hypothetical protein